jgi:hypothetical protein
VRPDELDEYRQLMIRTVAKSISDFRTGDRPGAKPTVTDFQQAEDIVKALGNHFVFVPEDKLPLVVEQGSWILIDGSKIGPDANLRSVMRNTLKYVALARFLRRRDYGGLK